MYLQISADDLQKYSVYKKVFKFSTTQIVEIRRRCTCPFHSDQTPQWGKLPT